ncbi:ATP-binding protein [Paenibacillus sediminis]|uniref:histidine kinase n=1 Tax=Paenibacillus sediminis TaxID=664909 RepID=A0ABS4H2H2_9BACL|nr:ATP-binding protein [Paenibacillus sediminis]MBP1936735.1 signal transduction histidine kinase [Paenibacillus sediminis]
MNTWTFSRKVSLSIAAASLIVAIIANIFVYVTFRHWTAQQETAMLDLKLRQLEIQIGEVEFLPHLLNPGRGKGSGAAAVFAPDLSPLASELNPGQRLELLDGDDVVLDDLGSKKESDHMLRKAERVIDLPAFGRVKLRLSESGLSQSAAALREVGRLLLLATSMTAVLAAFAGLVVARSTVAPIRGMIREVRSIGANNLSSRLRLPSAKDELYQLAETFNSFLHKLDTSFEKQRRFVADASHELKTPLAIIEGHASMVHRWGKSSAEVMDESLGFIMNETKRMKELVGQLLLLAEAEDGIPEDAGEISDLAATLKQLLPQTVHVNPEVKLSFVTGPVLEESIPIRMPAGSSYQVLRNIIENALKYTPAGGVVRILHDIQADEVVLTVEDTGIGIAKEQLPHVFDRFYRTEGSRTRSKGGSGLGLAITRTIMERYGGSIEIDSDLGIGTTVTLRFIRG